MEKKYLLGFVLSILVIIGLLVGFFYRLGIGFGRAVVDSVEEVNRVKKEWKDDEINPIDTIERTLVDFIDSADAKSSNP
jgi:hypothetical protein